LSPWLLLVAGIIILVGAVFLARRSWLAQKATGLPLAQVSVIYSDSGAWEKVAEPLFSETYGLTGKPDYVLETKKGLVPVELKPSRQADQPYESDVMQLAAYCLLLEEDWQEHPPYGLLRYREKTFRVEWTAELRQTLLDLLDEMRELHAVPAFKGGPLPEPQHDMTVRCHSCGFHYICFPDEANTP
jgi:CRISPR-associated exonuclease Cas4